MLEMETVQGGGWNTDTPGLDKTIETIILIAISKTLYLR